MVDADKTQLRAALLRARRAVSPGQREADAAALCAHLPGLVQSGSTVCAYVPVGTEPGALQFVDILVKLGARVLLPAARHDEAGVPLPLEWGEYRPGALVEAPFGLREPPRPWLPPDAVRDAAVVLVPALAVDRDGVRLGRGAGFYDRTLGLAARSALLTAVVRDDELLERLPAEPHDVRMTHALTPTAGLVRLCGQP